jgi:hypothetical protein
MACDDRKALRFFEFTLTHCFKGSICPKWRADYVTDYCGDKDMMVEKYVCTRFPKKKQGDGEV